MKKILKFLLAVIITSFITTGVITTMFMMKGVEFSVANTRISETLGGWLMLCAVFAYVVASSTIITFLVLTYLPPDLWNILCKDSTEIIESKALRSKITKQWYYWSEDAQEWMFSAVPFSLPITTTIEDINKAVPLPADAELISYKITI